VTGYYFSSLKMPSVCSLGKSTKKHIEFYGGFRAGFKKIVKQKGKTEKI
jgi:hypothetical protein